jgi:glutathione S-transferase
MEIVIGDKLGSSWSMRPWLALKRTGAPFTETLIPLRRETTLQALQKATPNGMVPVLKDGDLTVWDSLAICEYLAERFPDAQLWPAEPKARAVARAASAEMHAGFASLRGECAMDLSLRKEVSLSEATHQNIRRIVQLWSELRQSYGGGGPFLFGAWSIADAFYTPVATRFRSYGVRLSDYGDTGAAGTYAEALLESPEYLAWERDALQDAA